MRSNLFQTIRKRKNFLQLRKAKTSLIGKTIIINFKIINPCDDLSLGFTVTKKHGNAVKRNLIKRRLRALFIKNIKQIPKGYAFEVIPKEKIKGFDFLNIEKDLLNVVKKLN